MNITSDIDIDMLLNNIITENIEIDNMFNDFFNNNVNSNKENNTDSRIKKDEAIDIDYKEVKIN